MSMVFTFFAFEYLGRGTYDHADSWRIYDTKGPKESGRVIAVMCTW